MADRALRALVTLCAFLCLIGCANGTSANPAPPPEPAPQVRILQLNLCNSGIAGCFTGRATATAAAVIRAEAPDLVTLNEICSTDVAILEDALADAVTSAFQAARDARTGAPYRCRAGGEYGIGVLARWPQVPGSTPAGGIYPAQDPDDPEQRAWLCLDAAATPAVTVCTTHLAYTRRDVAQAQCEHLLGTVIAQVRARGAPVVLGADLNLGSGDDPQLRSCVPPGFVLAGDGGQQHVIATPGFAVSDVRSVDLRGSTDHPGLLVTLRR
jgi:endonuclease/exonuclease/phosphatase family metal-dependent hydrolase